MQGQNSTKRSDYTDESDIPEEELSDKEVAILFLIVTVFVTVVIVLPIVLSLSPTYK